MHEGNKVSSRNNVEVTSSDINADKINVANPPKSRDFVYGIKDIEKERNGLIPQFFIGRLTLLFDTYIDNQESINEVERENKMQLANDCRINFESLISGGHAKQSCEIANGHLSLGRYLRIVGEEAKCVRTNSKCKSRPVYFDLNDTPDTDNAFVNAKVSASSNDIWRYDLDNVQYHINFKHFDVSVDFEKAECNDTALHYLTIEDKQGGRIKLKNIRRLSIVQYDADKDKADELYILSAQPCGDGLRIIKLAPIRKPD